MERPRGGLPDRSTSRADKIAEKSVLLAGLKNTIPETNAIAGRCRHKPRRWLAIAFP
jgi:hypothetical protein